MGVRFWVVFFGVCLIGTRVVGDTTTCFDFNQAIGDPIAEAPVPETPDADVYVHGKTKEGIVWGQGKGMVSRSVRSVLDWLLQHENWKDMSKTKLKVTHLPTKAYFDLHRVEVSLRVLAFVSLNWVEQWAYRILEGNEKDPKRALALYQKTEGSAYLPMLCGSVLIEKRPDRRTDVYFYERAQSDYYESQMIEGMHRNHLDELRTPVRSLSSTSG